MTTTEVSQSTPTGAASRSAAVVAGVVVAALVVAAGGAWALPDLPTDASAAMTHYMELLATNQPWNLLMFMAVPVVLAETVAVTELVILFNRSGTVGAGVRALNRWAGLVGGLYFVGVFGYLFVHAVVPLTTDGGWRGPADVIAVGAYLSGVIPLFGIALLELGVLGRGRDQSGRLKLHAALVGVFLVVAHLAMIFGMLDPTQLGWHTPGHAGMHM